LIHCGEKSVVVEGLFLNASMWQVNWMSFSEAASSSSWVEVVSSLAYELELGCFLCLGFFFFFSEDLEVGAEANVSGRRGETLKRQGGTWVEGLKVIGVWFSLHTSGVIIRGDLTLHPKMVLSRSSGSTVVDVVSVIGIKELIVKNVVRVVR
jgi:hypothetical protein